MLMKHTLSIDTLRDCAAFTTRLNRLAATYGVITSTLSYNRYLHLYALLLGRESYEDLKNNFKEDLQVDYLKISSILRNMLSRQLPTTAQDTIKYDLKFLTALVESILETGTYSPSVEEDMMLYDLYRERNVKGLEQLYKQIPVLGKFVLYGNALKAMSKVDIVEPDTSLLTLKSYKVIKNYIYEQVTEFKNFVSLFQLVFAHKYIPRADINYSAKVVIADWFNDADEDGALKRQDAFHRAWAENFVYDLDMKYRFFVTDDADSFKRDITLYDTLTVFMNPSICDEYKEKMTWN